MVSAGRSRSVSVSRVRVPPVQIWTRSLVGKAVALRQTYVRLIENAGAGRMSRVNSKPASGPASPQSRKRRRYLDQARPRRSAFMSAARSGKEDQHGKRIFYAAGRSRIHRARAFATMLCPGRAQFIAGGACLRMMFTTAIFPPAGRRPRVLRMARVRFPPASARRP